MADAQVDTSQLGTRAASARARRNRVGTISLLVAIVGAVSSHLMMNRGPLVGAAWLPFAAAGFEAALVGGLADWFAVTALFRHPLGIPIPHTAIIPTRRTKIVESIVSMVQDDWLSPDVIQSRLARLAPGRLVIDWLHDPAHVERLGAPVRDLLRSATHLLTEPEVIAFVNRTLQRQLRELPIDAGVGRWLREVAASRSAAAAFESAARSLANVLGQPATAETLQRWIDQSARQLYRDGRRLVPLLLRRKMIQRRIVDAVCEYGAAELRETINNADHPWRRYAFGVVARFAERLAAGDREALAQVEQLRTTVVESLEGGPIIRDLLSRLAAQLEDDLDHPDSHLSEIVDRQLHAGIVELLEDPDRHAAFDRWVKATATDLLRRHHHQIGVTVRENLEALDTQTLVARIEDRVGNDLQFIRLNGAVVGGLIGLLIAVIRQFLQ